MHGRCRRFKSCMSYTGDWFDISSADRALPPCFISPLLPRPRNYLGECQRNYIAPNAGSSERVQFPSLRAPIRQTVPFGTGAGPRDCFFTLVAKTKRISGKCWWNYILSQVRILLLISLLRVAQLVEQKSFHRPLVVGPEYPGECWAELHFGCRGRGFESHSCYHGGIAQMERARNVSPFPCRREQQRRAWLRLVRVPHADRGGQGGDPYQSS